MKLALFLAWVASVLGALWLGYVSGRSSADGYWSRYVEKFYVLKDQPQAPAKGK